MCALRKYTWDQSVCSLTPARGSHQVLYGYVYVCTRVYVHTQIMQEIRFKVILCTHIRVTITDSIGYPTKEFGRIALQYKASTYLDFRAITYCEVVKSGDDRQVRHRLLQRLALARRAILAGITILPIPWHMTLSPTTEAIRVKSCEKNLLFQVKIYRHDGQVPFQV